MATVRKPRRKRVKTSRSFRISGCDVKILMALNEYGLCRSNHLDRFLPFQPDPIRRRLRHLFDAGYIYFIPEMSTQRRYAGSRPTIWRLEPKGAAYLLDEFGSRIPKPRVLDTDEDGHILVGTPRHTLLTTEFMASIAGACKASQTVEFISPQMLRDSMPEHVKEGIQSGQSLFSWLVSINYEGQSYSLWVRPDAVFGLHYLNQPEGKRNAYFCLEADRGGEQVEYHGKLSNRQSITRKLLTYRRSSKSAFQEHFGIPVPMRVIFLVKTKHTGSKRTANFIAENQRLFRRREESQDIRGSRQFLFLPYADYQDSQDILTLPIRNGVGERVTLNPFQ